MTAATDVVVAALSNCRRCVSGRLLPNYSTPRTFDKGVPLFSSDVGGALFLAYPTLSLCTAFSIRARQRAGPRTLGANFLLPLRCREMQSGAHVGLDVGVGERSR